MSSKRTVLFPGTEGELLEVDFDADIRQVVRDDCIDVVLVLLESKDRQTITCLNRDGTERFSVLPPTGWSFYYLSSHINHPLAVVCTSPTERFDWFYGINENTGELVSLNRAY